MIDILREHTFGWKQKQKEAFFRTPRLSRFHFALRENSSRVRGRPLRRSDSLGREGGREGAQSVGAVKTISDKDFKTSRRNMPRLQWSGVEREGDTGLAKRI